MRSNELERGKLFAVELILARPPVDAETFQDTRRPSHSNACHVANVDFFQELVVEGAPKQLTTGPYVLPLNDFSNLCSFGETRRPFIESAVDILVETDMVSVFDTVTEGGKHLVVVLRNIVRDEVCLVYPAHSAK